MNKNNLIFLQQRSGVAFYFGSFSSILTVSVDLFNFSKQREELVLICDIGSASVGAALVRISRGDMHQSPVILVALREPLVFSDTLNFHTFLDTTLSALEKVVQGIAKSNRGGARELHVLLSSPWFAGQTRIVHIKKDEAFQVSKTMIDDLLNQEVTQFENTQIKKYMELDKTPKIIEQTIMQVLANGYSVSSPEKKKVKELSLSVFMSMAPEHVMATFREKIVKIYHHNLKTVFHTSLFSFFTIARDTFVEEKDFLIVDIGGEITDIGIVRGDILKETVSFPEGSNAILREYMNTVRVSLDEAERTLALYYGGTLEESRIPVVEKVLEQVGETWSRVLLQTLETFSKTNTVPAVVCLSAPARVLSWYADRFKGDTLHHILAAEQSFRVIPLSASVFKEYVVAEAGVVFDPISMIHSLFITKV